MSAPAPVNSSAFPVLAGPRSPPKDKAAVELPAPPG